MSVQTSVLFDFPLSAPGVVRGSPVAVNTRVAEVAIQAGLFVCQGTLEEHEARFGRRVDTAQGVSDVIREAGVLPR